MEQFDDGMLKIVSDKVDLFISESCVKYKMPPLSLSAVILARLIHLNNSVKTSDDMAKLLLSVGESILNKELEVPDRLH